MIKNPLARRLHIDVDKVKNLDFESIQNEILEKENIPYEICHPASPEDFMKKYYPLAIAHKAPFDSSSDKGLKDALIASSIERFLSENPKTETVYLATKDKRLAKYFEKHNRVTIIEKFPEYDEANNSHCENMDSDSSTNYANGKSKLNNVPTSKIDKGYKIYDSRTEDISDFIFEFVGSGSFTQTHSAVSNLAPYRDSLTDSQKCVLLKAATENNQIYWVLQDEDVAKFLLPIFKTHQDVLTEEQYRTFVNSAGLPYERLDEYGNVSFSNSERKAYENFVSSLINSISLRHYGSCIKSDSDIIRDNLHDLLSKASLDHNLLAWKFVYDALIDGQVVPTSDDSVSESVLQAFVELLDAASVKKRDTIIQMLSNRFDIVVEDYPF